MECLCVRTLFLLYFGRRKKYGNKQHAVKHLIGSIKCFEVCFEIEHVVHAQTNGTACCSALQQLQDKNKLRQIAFSVDTQYER